MVREYEKGIITVIETGVTIEKPVPLMENIGISNSTQYSSPTEGINNNKINYLGLLKKIIPYLRQFGIRKTLKRILEKLYLGN